MELYTALLNFTPMLKRLLLFLLLGFSALLNAQQKERTYVDSLKNAIAERTTDDTVKADLLGRLSFAYISIDPKEGIKQGQEALALSQKLGWRKGEAQAYNSIGANYRVRSDYPNALENFLKALDINEEIHNAWGIATNNGNIGIVYKKQGDFENALIYYEKARSAYEQLNDRKGVAVNLGNMGIVFNTQRKFSKALEYEFKALEIWKKDGNAKNVALWLGNISLVYSDSGLYTEALKYAERALQINDSLGVKKGIADNCRNIGSIYFGMSNDSTVSSAERTAARRSAIVYLERARLIAEELGDLINLQEINEISYKIHLANGDATAALNSYREFVRYRDSISSRGTKEKIEELITQREVLVRDKELEIGEQQIEIDRLAVEKKRNERVFYVVGILLLLIVIVIMFRNRMNQKRANRLLAEEKDKSEDLLLNILPAKVAQELKQTGASRAQLFDQVTVLFTDFVNFTQAAEHTPPQQLVDELHTCFKEFDAIIARHGIEKIKTVGDAYIAVCGLPQPDAQHAPKVVNAAIEIASFMKERRAKHGERIFEVRIGVHTGSVVAGIVGVKKIAYDIWGDTVNVAARMESSGEPGKVNISGVTHKEIANDERFRFEFRGNIEAKHKGKIEMYFVTNADR
jgi:class 3 adenylate cyclase